MLNPNTKRAIINSKPFRALYLLASLFFAKPLEFSNANGGRLSRFARAKWVRTLPLIPAGIFATAMNSWLEWVGYERQALENAPVSALRTYMSEVHSARFVIFAGTALSLYAVSLGRYSFHHAWARIWRRLGHPCSPVPVSYFYVNTAAVSTWLALYSYALVALIQRYGIDFRNGLSQLASTRVYIVITLSFLVVGGVTAIRRNRKQGMLEVYGYSRWRLALVDVAGIGLWVCMAFLLSVIDRHA